ncbi:MAG TPA: type II secretion system secretin GspD [Anaeromyxobacter sp.]|nr:type II secretion system secretin GspD [Anaeromyxobacter sp.]
MRKLVAAVVLAPALALAQVPIRPQPTDPQGRPLPTGPLPTTPTGPSATPPPAPSPAPRAAPSATPPRATSPGGAQAPGNGRARSNANTEPLRATDARCVPLQGRFMLSFNKADIVDILEQASRWTCRNFVYTDDIARGKITLLSKTPVTADEAYAAFLAALNSNNISVYATGRYYKLIRTADSKKNPIPTYTGPSSETPANEQPVTKVIRLQYADADQMRGIVGNFLSPQGADVQSIPPDMLIVTDIALNLRRIERILDAVDRAGAGDLVRIVQIRYAAAKDIADKINQIFQAQGPKAARRSFGTPSPAAPRPPGVTAVPAPAPAVPAGAAGADRPGEVSVSKILPDERTNKLIIIADEKGFQRIQELIDQLDVPTSGEGGIHVVFLRNANAEELAQTLSNLAQGRARRQGGTPGAPAGVPTPGAPQLPQVRPASTGLPGAGGDVTAELFSGEVKITSDKAQNALLIQASGADFLALQRLIERLDRPRRQVFVEAVILEVTLRNDVELGVGAHAAVPFDYKGDTGIIPIASEPGRVSSFNLLQAAGLGGFLTGFSGPVTAEIKNLGFAFPSIGFLVQALQSSSDANVLSTPHIVATDNEESEITVGQNVPFQAGFTPSGLSGLIGGATNPTTGTNTALGGLTGLTGLSGLIAPIQRQPVELRVKIKPQINEGGNVRLSVDAQNEEITERDAQLGPTTSKRTVKTQIVARDQSTIVIGGLIQERNVRSVKRVPLLGSLPIVGWLFRDQQTTKQKTNLLIFLTPYIIRDESDYRRIYERKRKEQQQFIEQFYGRQPAYEVDVDFARKAGPYTRMHSGVVEESSRLENGGTGGPGERIAPARGERGAPPSLAPPQGDRPQGAVPPAPVPPRQPPEREEEGTPVDRLEVQPDVPTPPGDQDGQTAPPAPAPQSPPAERPPG